MGSKITKERFINLKSRVKAEMNRRGLSAWGNSNYDYSVVPERGIKILKEHYEKNAVPIMNVNSDYGLSTTAEKLKVKDSDMLLMENAITTLEGYNNSYQGGHGCKNACTGFCSSEYPLQTLPET